MTHNDPELAHLRDRALVALPQGVCITDARKPDNPIVYVNRGFELLTGYAAEEVVGRNCRFLQGPNTDPAGIAAVRAAVRAGRPCSVELVNHRKDGSTFRNALAVAPVHDAGGAVTHFVASQTDTTEFRQLEEQLRHAQKMEAVGQLAGGVAHDFNNLLTVINGYSELMLAAPLPEAKRREFLAEVHAAGERAADLTRQLLAFSRKAVVHPRPVDLNAVVGGVERMLARLIGEDVRLEADLGPLAGRVRLDAGQFEQVLVNLAVNARDAMPAGGRLTLSTAEVGLTADLARPHVAPGRYARLSVADTGTGMTDEVRARVFEPFFTTKEVGKGTGLGLATVYGIVRQAGGHVEVESAVGRGTTFRVFLPLAAAAAAADTPGPRRSPPTGTETILLVEDEDRVRRLAAEALRGGGYTVLEAGAAGDALGVVAARPSAVNLLLTDVVMPGMNGRLLAERLADEGARPRVLYMSGYTDDAVVRHGVQTDEVAFIRKPFTVDALLHKVRDVLDGRLARPSAA